MPELPEVETVRRQLEPLVVGRIVVDAGGLDSPKFTPAVDAVGYRVHSLGRRGKYLLATMTQPGRQSSDTELIVHLGMTGSLAVRPVPSDDHYVRAWWTLDDGATLELRDVRRFGRVHFVAVGDYAAIPTLRDLGPEPLGDDFTEQGLYRSLRRSRRAVKTQLLSQRPVAGVGNIYADEALWRSRIRPTCRRIGDERAARLHAAIRAVLEAGLACGGTTLRDYRDARGEAGAYQHHLDCYGRGGEPCPRCGVTLRTTVVDARGTTFCPSCQAR